MVATVTKVECRCTEKSFNQSPNVGKYRASFFMIISLNSLPLATVERVIGI